MAQAVAEGAKEKGAEATLFTETLMEDGVSGKIPQCSAESIQDIGYPFRL